MILMRLKFIMSKIEKLYVNMPILKILTCVAKKPGLKAKIYGKILNIE